MSCCDDRYGYRSYGPGCGRMRSGCFDFRDDFGVGRFDFDRDDFGRRRFDFDRDDFGRRRFDFDRDDFRRRRFDRDGRFFGY